MAANDRRGTIGGDPFNAGRGAAGLLAFADLPILARSMAAVLEGERWLRLQPKGNAPHAQRNGEVPNVSR
ncbi:MAG: hypothetical protein EOR33_28295 [Mesorhizobium sp.]|nr:MAG: hypothetical protein EOR33_28295 [Mesorhizobium sp.]